MYILGINFSHHGSICLLKDGEVVFFLEEERVSRKKAIFISDRYHNVIDKIKQYTDKLDYVCVGFDYNSVDIDKDDIILNYSEEVISKISDGVIKKALSKNKELINQYKDHDGSYFVQYTDIVWDEISKLTTPETKLYIDLYSHHNLHASQAFYNSGFKEAVCVIVDGRGSSKRGDKTDSIYERESIWKYNYNSYEELYSNYNIHVNGIGATYTKVTGILGFSNMFEEGKTMGLASYKPSDITDNPEMSSKIAMANEVQNWSQELVLNLIKHAIEISGSKNVCVSGGYGLNCVANYFFRKNLPADVNLYCEPIANDAGQSIGIAKKLYHKVTGDTTIRPQTSIYFGPEPQY